MANILRPPAARQKVSVKRTKFHEDYVLHDENDPYVPGTEGQVRRVRPVPLGERAVGFLKMKSTSCLDNCVLGAMRSMPRSSP